MDNIPTSEISFSDDDFKVDWYSGTGKGGQKRNKSQSCCRVTHLPSNLTESRQGRSREKNKFDAIESLKSQVIAHSKSKDNLQHSIDRKLQVGSGMRGDKIVTLREKDNHVINHVNGKTTTFKRFMKGDMNLLT